MIRFGIGGDTRRPSEELLLYSFDGNDVSFWIYSGILRHHASVVSVEIETWLSVSGGEPRRACHLSSSMNVLRFVRMDSPMSFEWELEQGVKQEMVTLINRNWKTLASALPDRLKPKTYPAFGWEIASYPLVGRLLVSAEACSA